MNDLEYTIRKICERRGVTLSKVESVVVNTKCAFGLVDGTALLPTVAGAFYFLPQLVVSYSSITGVPYLSISGPVNPAGSGGVFGINLANRDVFQSFECDNLLYNVGTHTAGTFYVVGSGFKITYA